MDKHNVRSLADLLLSSCLALFLATSDAPAQSVSYEYDALGRLVKVVYPGNAQATYAYDAAGNRTQAVNAAPYSATITISAANSVNLRTLADANGYPGGDGTITFNHSGILTGDPGAHGIDTGTWPGGVTLSITLNNSGTIRGGGGAGAGANGAGNGADAIYARTNLTINNAGGTIQGGGGGGGFGGAWRRSRYDGECQVESVSSYYSGGGGGGFPNGLGAAAFVEPFGDPIGSAGAGSAGTVSGGGAGGAGGSAGTGRQTGSGGAGGGVAASGASGTAATGSEAAGCPPISEFFLVPAAGGGAAGYAVRKNGNTVTVTGGTIEGTAG